jgi:ubiquinone/menaquinone biosynthesis C-methylase UbiE
MPRYVTTQATDARLEEATLPYCKLCELEDFNRPELWPFLQEVFADVFRDVAAFPARQEHRKLWEIAMAARALTELGVVHDDAEILGVGAGHEATIYWLTTRVRRVFATDLYLEPGSWESDASPTMLIDPGRRAPSHWNPRRLVVQHMNALELRYDEASFEGVFSSSAIEHFGGHEEVLQAAREMHRVLKPGGVAAISTEFRLRGPSPGLPDLLLLDEDELRALVVGAANWQLASELSLEPSARTLATELDHSSVLAGDAPLPYIVLAQGDYAWTSVHLALRKPSP